jgi:hypothetical protein
MTVTIYHNPEWGGAAPVAILAGRQATEPCPHTAALMTRAITL